MEVPTGRPVGSFAVLVRRLSTLLVRERAPEQGGVPWALATGCAVFGITTARIPVAWNSIWADDARFLEDAHNRGIGAFGHFYGGYLHLAPRLGALVAGAVPIRWSAAAMTTYAVIVTALCGSGIEVTSGAHLNSRWVRVGLGLSVALLPAMRVEALANMANLQFVLLFAAFWTLLWLPQRTTGQVSGAILVSVAGLSSLLGVVLVPIAVLRLTTRRGRPIAAAMLASIGVHVALVLAFRPRRVLDGAGLREIVRGYELLVDSHLIGGPFGAVRYERPTFLVVLAVLALLGVVLVLSPSPERRRRMLLVGIVATLSVVLWVGETLTSGTAARYAVLPALLLLGAVAIGVDAALELRRPWRTLGTAMPVLAVLLSAVWSFTPAAFRVDGPRWSPGLTAARRTCATSSAKRVSIRVLPTHGATWKVSLPCGTVEPTTRGASAAGASLTGPTWVLDPVATSLGGPTTGLTVTARFTAHDVDGVDGCNRYTAGYRRSGTTMRNVHVHVTTHRACTAGSAPVEQAFLARLGDVRGYRTGARTLVLRDASRRPILAFVRAALR